MEYTYNTLLASCQNYCIDNSTEYETEFPNIVQLSEMMIIKDLGLSVFDTSESSTLTLGSQSITKPSDIIADRDLFITVSSARVYLQKRSKSWIDDYWRNSNLQDQPAYYCDDSTTTWKVAPTPDQSYPYMVNYIARPEPMSSDNQTTWIGTKLGECLLYATLLGSMPFFREDVATEQGITGYWKGQYDLSIGKALVELSPLVSAKNNVLFPQTVNVGG